MSKAKVKQHDALVKKFLTNFDTARDFTTAIENIISALKFAYTIEIDSALVQSSIYYLLLGREGKS